MFYSEYSSAAQQVGPTKIQTTNLYTAAPPFGWGLQRPPRAINDSAVVFTAAGRHRGDLTAVIQALLSPAHAHSV